MLEIKSRHLTWGGPMTLCHDKYRPSIHLSFKNCSRLKRKYLEFENVVYQICPTIVYMSTLECSDRKHKSYSWDGV